MARSRASVSEIRDHVQGRTFDEKDMRRWLRDPRSGVKALGRRARDLLRADVAESQRLEGLLTFEKELWRSGSKLVAGVDEVGAGPLAGPVVAAAVILPVGIKITGIDDSKRLRLETRLELDRVIRQQALSVSIAAVEPQEIDRINILQASRQAMRKAVEGLIEIPEHLLVDARNVPGVCQPQTPIIDGDAKSMSIAAASIVAKVFRDALMEDLARQYPGYGFEKNRGYGTAEHMTALQRLGPTPCHRFSFAPVREAARRFNTELCDEESVSAAASPQSPQLTFSL